MNKPPKTIRVTVPVSPQVLERFQRYSAVSGLSVGRSMADWLHDTQEGLDFVTETLEHAKKAPQEAVRNMQMYAVALQDMTGEVLTKVNAMPGARPETAVGGSSLALAAARLGVGPPSCNTGGKVLPKKKTTGGKV